MIIDNEPIRTVDYIKYYLGAYQKYLTPPHRPRLFFFSIGCLRKLFQKLLYVSVSDEIDSFYDETDENYDAEWLDFEHVESEVSDDDHIIPLEYPAGYCGACESNPCMCSDGEKTSATLGW